MVPATGPAPGGRNARSPLTSLPCAQAIDLGAGHKIENFFPADGTFAVPSMTAVVKGSKNPNAAKLLAEYTVSLEAQQLWPQSGIYAARSDVEPPAGSPPIKDVKVLPMDYGYIRGVSATVRKRFSEIFST